MKNIKLKLCLFIIIIALLITATGCNLIKTKNKTTTQINKKQKIAKLLKNSKFYYLDEKEKLTPYYETAEQKKQEILNSPTEIVKSDKFIAGKTYTGTAYYISAKGADFNNGLTPETPIKTIKQLNRTNLKKGDAVFFERGYIYRTPKEALIVQPYITYSAYGQGEKPILTRVAENSARTEYWQLYYEGKNGEKIWKYYKKIGDVAGIVFDDETYATRVLEWPTKKGWLALNLKKMEPHKGIRAQGDATTNIQVQSANEYKTIEQALNTDLTYISRINIEKLKYPFEIFKDCKKGELYLRYDKGNPAEYFSDIEIISFERENKKDMDGRIFDSTKADNYTIDNLAIKYFTINAKTGNIVKNNNVIIQNSTIKWGGGSLYKITSDKPTNNFLLLGDGIYLIGRNTIFKNNYISQCGNALVLEDFKEGKTDMGTFSIEDNVIENCGQGLRLGLQRKIRKNSFDRITIKNNIILNSGDSMNNACFE